MLRCMTLGNWVDSRRSRGDFCYTPKMELVRCYELFLNSHKTTKYPVANTEKFKIL
jgi:hypothetical protein